jgi:hypothetical protein
MITLWKGFPQKIGRHKMGQLYEVVDIVETVNITKSGDVEKIHKVRARTPGGQQFALDIRDQDFDEKKVRELLTARAKLIDAVMKS